MCQAFAFLMTSLKPLSISRLQTGRQMFSNSVVVSVVSVLVSRIVYSHVEFCLGGEFCHHCSCFSDLFDMFNFWWRLDCNVHLRKCCVSCTIIWPVPCLSLVRVSQEVYLHGCLDLSFPLFSACLPVLSTNVSRKDHRFACAATTTGKID